MIQSVNLPPSAHTITSSAHCNTLQPSATCSQPSIAYPVHTLQQPLHLQCTLQPCTAMYSYLQPTFGTHCSQMQLSTTIYTAAIHHIQCTLQLHHAVHITFIVPLDHQWQMSQPNMLLVVSDSLSSPNDEEDWLIVAVQMMKKSGW